jgi:tetratricopeptide (TPR) repeat protein
MRPTRTITAVLLLAAFGAVACSKRDRSARKQAHKTDTAQTKPIAHDLKPQPVAPPVPAKDAAPTVGEPLSFADGQAAYQAKKYGEAAAIFEAYTERHPGNGWGHYMLGLAAWKHGDLPKSEKAFDMALRIDPKHVKSLVNQSRLFNDLKRHDDAIDRLSRAVDLDPENREVNRLLAHTYHLQGKTEEAVAVYRQVLEADEYDAWSLNNLGLLLVETERAEEAVPLLTKAVALRKEVAEFHNSLGLALEHTGHLRAAAEAYSGALLADPGFEKAKHNLQRVEAVKGGSEVK